MILALLQGAQGSTWAGGPGTLDHSRRWGETAQKGELGTRHTMATGRQSARQPVAEWARVSKHAEGSGHSEGAGRRVNRPNWHPP